MQAFESVRIPGLKSRVSLSVALAASLLASVAPAPSAAAVNKQELIACFVVHNGSFDQGKGAVFFSEVGDVTIVNGMRQGDPSNSFRAKVKASYNVSGAAACETGPDAAKLRAYLAEVGGSYKRHKQVQTGLKPLD